MRTKDGWKTVWFTDGCIMQSKSTNRLKRRAKEYNYNCGTKSFFRNSKELQKAIEEYQEVRG